MIKTVKAQIKNSEPMTKSEMELSMMVDFLESQRWALREALLKIQVRCENKLSDENYRRINELATEALIWIPKDQSS